jgi:hypothetical protein
MSPSVYIARLFQRSGNSLPITLDLERPAAAFAFQIAEITAWTGIPATPHLSMNTVAPGMLKTALTALLCGSVWPGAPCLRDAQESVWSKSTTCTDALIHDGRPK